jgi:hypothetical protein
LVGSVRGAKMEIIKKGKNIIVKHTLKRNQTYRIQKGQSIESLTILNKPQVVSGFSNRCEDGMQILTIDYDNVDISVVEEDWEFISQKFELSFGYLFKTAKGFHVICLQKFIPAEIYEILRYTRCDDNYRDMPLRNPFRSYVLRISPKKNGKRPKFIKKLDSFIDNPTISKAHRMLLHKLYPKIKFPHWITEDTLTKVKLNVYETK